jgi:hypothetical protein
VSLKNTTKGSFICGLLLAYHGFSCGLFQGVAWFQLGHKAGQKLGQGSRSDLGQSIRGTSGINSTEGVVAPNFDAVHGGTHSWQSVPGRSLSLGWACIAKDLGSQISTLPALTANLPSFICA